MVTRTEMRQAARKTAPVIKRAIEELSSLSASTPGWAVRDAQGLKIKTVSSSRRAAIINWLVTECQVAITATMDDGMIERVWETWRAEAETVQVAVFELPTHE